MCDWCGSPHHSFLFLLTFISFASMDFKIFSSFFQVVGISTFGDKTFLQNMQKKRKKKRKRKEVWRYVGGMRIWNFHPGVLKKYHAEFSEMIKKEVEFSRVTKKDFLALEFPRDLTKICGISKGGASFYLEFPRKTSRGVSKKYILNHPRASYL